MPFMFAIADAPTSMPTSCAAGCATPTSANSSTDSSNAFFRCKSLISFFTKRLFELDGCHSNRLRCWAVFRPTCERRQQPTGLRDHVLPFARQSSHLVGEDDHLLGFRRW